MRHRKSVAKLGRTSAHRKAMLKNMAVSLINKEKIKTTKTKAKVLKSYIEKLITRAKKNTVHSKRIAAKKIEDRRALIKLFDNIAPRYEKRPGGYTRIYTMGPRAGDAAEMAIIELVEEEISAKVKTTKTDKKKLVSPEKKEIKSDNEKKEKTDSKTESIAKKSEKKSEKVITEEKDEEKEIPKEDDKK